jgi:MFS family permease
MRTEDVIKPARAIPTSTRAWMLAALALITPLGLILVNVAAYVMGHLAGFRVGVTASAVVSTIVLNGIAAITAYRYGVARWPDWSEAPRPQPLIPRLSVWLLAPRRRQAVMVEVIFILVFAATVGGELTYHGLSDPRQLPNWSTFLGGLAGLVLALPLILAALYRRGTGRRERRRYRTR